VAIKEYRDHYKYSCFAIYMYHRGNGYKKKGNHYLLKMAIVFLCEYDELLKAVLSL
jgi:hypothetical protein